MLSHLKSLIANDQVESVIDYLLKLELDEDLHNEIILISGGAQNLEKGKAAAWSAINICQKYLDLARAKNIAKWARKTLQDFEKIDMPALQKLHKAQHTYIRAKQRLDHHVGRLTGII